MVWGIRQSRHLLEGSDTMLLTHHAPISEVLGTFLGSHAIQHKDRQIQDATRPILEIEVGAGITLGDSSL